MRTFALATLALSLPALVFAQRSDEDVQEAIKKELKKDKITLRVTVANGNAVLEGAVRNIFAKDRALEIALNEPEVEGVEDEIEVSAAESDDELGKEVIKEIRRYGEFDIFDDAGAIVKEGKVVLLGFVTQPFKRNGIEKRMQNVLGIQEFENQIQVLPNSQQDDNLRRALANRLYRDPLFSDFARMAHPPIRIIVQRSRVLLTGAVRNTMARQRAEAIIRQTPGVLTVENRLRVD